MADAAPGSIDERRAGSVPARRRTGRRNVVSTGSLFSFGSDEGAASLGVGEWPQVEVDTEHPALAGVAEQDLYAAVVFGCGADVFR